MFSKIHKLAMILTVCFGSFLLFSIQPLVAKQLLPLFGGTSAVWTACLLFFQSMLLLGYAYVWFVTACFPRHWHIIHFALLVASFVCLPTGLFDYPLENPLNHVLLTLLFSIGLIVAVLATTAPLIQFAYQAQIRTTKRSSYFLYAASNTGSLGALLLYPSLIEPTMTLTQQTNHWNIGIAFYLLLVAFSLATVKPRQKQKALTWPKHSLLIAVFSFLPCSTMIAVTAFLTTDISATPLLWVIPLFIYLLSYILTFNQRLESRIAWLSQYAWVGVILPFVALAIGMQHLSLAQLLGFHLTGLTAICLYCHHRLYRVRSQDESSPGFYFIIASAGVVAGLFNSLLAPWLFSDTYEYGLMLFIVLLIITHYTPRWRQKGLILLVGIVGLITINIPQQKAFKTIAQARNFFAVKKVVAGENYHGLMSQSTLHGIQFFEKDKAVFKTNLFYYAPVAQVQRLIATNQPQQVVIIGLGVGMLACDFPKSTQLKFIEIDPQVIQFAQNDQYFQYLKHCPVKSEIIEDDGRLAIKKMTNQQIDFLVIDAFNSDAIPTHLLTNQAFKLYQHKLKKDGQILIHISNRHINLKPVLSAVARELGWAMLIYEDKGNQKQGQLPSKWVLLTENNDTIVKLLKLPGWRFSGFGQQLAWTDDYMPIFPLIKR